MLSVSGGEMNQSTPTLGTQNGLFTFNGNQLSVTRNDATGNATFTPQVIVLDP
jgi:hypothetical protein